MITYENGLMENGALIDEIPSMNISSLIGVSSSSNGIEKGKSIVKNLPKYVYDNIYYEVEPRLNIPSEYEHLIWFLIPRQVILYLSNDYENNRSIESPLFHLWTILLIIEIEVNKGEDELE